MKESYTLSLNAKYADLVISSMRVSLERVKRVSPKTCQVVGEVGDALFCRAREDFSRSGAETYEDRLVYGCRIDRTYTRKEIEQARLFVIGTRYQHGAAEEYGTWYTDAPHRPECGIKEWPKPKCLTCALGSRQVGPLHFPFLKFVKRDIFSLWGGETILSERMADLIREGGFSGASLQPVWNTRSGSRSLLDLADSPTGLELLAHAKRMGLEPSDKAFWSWLESKEQLPRFDQALSEIKEIAESRHSGSEPARSYFQLVVQSSPIRVCEPTVLGDPFFGGNLDRCKCEFGEIRGPINSVLYTEASSWDGSDLCQTDLYFGGRQGCFRPWRQLVISKRLLDAMRQSKMKGFKFEIVEMV
jgi:hypothetical protein